MESIKIPYGIADFKRLREEKYIYVDKTKYLETLENYPMTIYVRPRRFGKSLFTSTLGYYYDLNEEENFEKLYKGLYIYDHPTEKKNSYYVLNFNFSGMNVSDGKTLEEIEETFDDKVKLYCEKFIAKYELPIELENKNRSAATLLSELFMKFSLLKKEHKIYIIIDEYDHFTNGMLEGNVSAFLKALGQGGFVRAFYEVIKEYAEGLNSVIDRFFATGVAPLTLDSLTSGFNIATNLSIDSDFIAMCGLTEEEVRGMMEKARLEEKVYEELKKNYDGYRFAVEKEEHTFNVTLVMYYLRNYIEMGEAPLDPIDQNLATTGNKIESMVNLLSPQKNYEKLVELVTRGEVSASLVKRFELNEKTFDENSFLSLLFYQGYITIKEADFDVTFVIPNHVSEVLYASFFTKMIEEEEAYEMDTSMIKHAIKEFGKNGKIEEISEVVRKFLMNQSVRDKENFSEKTLKYIYSLFFSLSNQYYVYGEFPAGQGFADILIEKSSVSRATYEAVIELKYISKGKAKMVHYDKLKEEGKEQLKNYVADKRLGEKENLKKFVIIFEGFEKFYIEEVE